MSIWVKIAEQVTALGSDIAAGLRRIAGKGDSGPADPEKSVGFTIGMIALGAKMAKVDGAVTEREVKAFREVFHIPPDELPNVAYVFNMAKQDVAGYELYAGEVAALFGDQPGVLEDVLDGLFHIAKADGAVGQPELAYLRNIAEIFGLAERFRCIRARHIVAGEDDPYVVLGVDPCVDDRELRRLFREIVREYHPDRHIAAGMPKELIEIATQRLAAINGAWEKIRKERGI
ncbi:MAG TPA: TerB family tellurite resistance protein [Aestuariivirgaceae bacterium]|jgi:DnaJ like chaperone protein|nr:TerB family tellurite resistance protein [Aestuariivirgaceae bacterium]